MRTLQTPLSSFDDASSLKPKKKVTESITNIQDALHFARCIKKQIKHFNMKYSFKK
jgi:hypothetical protein